LLVASGLLAVALGIAGAPAPRLGAVTVVSIVILGVFGTGIAYVLNYLIIMSDGATVASTVTYLLPVVAIILGVAVLGEHMSLAVLAGIALILSGVALVRRKTAA
jgi:drug/metabolite transporter (DMT)-like permease